MYPAKSLEPRRQRCTVQTTSEEAVEAWRGHSCSPMQQPGESQQKAGMETRAQPWTGRWKEARNCGQSEAPEDNFPSQNVKPCSVSFCANFSASLWPLQSILNEYIRKHDCSSPLATKMSSPGLPYPWGSGDCSAGKVLPPQPFSLHVLGGSAHHL